LQNTPAIRVPDEAGAIRPGTGLPESLIRQLPLLLIPPPAWEAWVFSCRHCCCGVLVAPALLPAELATATPMNAGQPMRIVALPWPAAIW